MRVNGILIALVAILLAGAAPTRQPHKLEGSADGVPVGMVSFFTSVSCPTGWKSADLAAGRLVVATEDPTVIGRPVGSALGDAEDRTHVHNVASSVSLPAKSISAADGGNDSGAASGDRALAGSAGAATSGLAFLQLTACVRSLQ